MRRSLTLTALLIMALYAAACSASEPQQAERAAPSQEKQTAPATQGVAKENAPQKSDREEATRKRAPANDEAAQGEQGPTQEDQEDPSSSGLSVTTIEGEEVTLGGQGDVTALYFMAGW